MTDILSKVPVKVSIVLGKAKMTAGQLLNMEEGSIVELDKKVDEEVDIYVNDSLVAKGEIVEKDNQLAVVLTEIITD